MSVSNIDKELENISSLHERLNAEIHKVIIGQNDVIRNLLSALLARGHCLLIGVPGLAKTMLVKTLAQCMQWDYKRIQFTPDLMPSDIVGSEILDVDAETGRRSMRFVKGPIFANVILADEINRTPPKTQSALLEAMQEYSVTVGGKTLPLAPPFFVAATQNPIEQEGTYPLPEAQLDRFMYSLPVDYPTVDDEMRIADETTGNAEIEVKPVCEKDELIQAQRFIRELPVSRHVLSYAVNMVRATRPSDASAPALVKKYVQWGAGPRASQYLILGAKTLAVLQGKLTPTAQNVRQAIPLVLSHRIILNYTAAADDITVWHLLASLMEQIEEPSYV